MAIITFSTSPPVSTTASLPSRNQFLVNEPTKAVDTVTISEAAQAMLSSSVDGSTTSVTDNWRSRAAHADPADAEKLAYEFSHASDGALVDITEYAKGTGPIRYTATGQPVTEESKTRFDNLAKSILEERTNLYDTEKAKGTPAAEIVDKIISFMNTQPAWYLELSGWSK